MKKTIVVFALIGLLGMGACNHNGTNKENTESPAGDRSKPENGGVKVNINDLSTKKDVVCGMDINDAQSIGDTTFYDGKMYGFCSSECKDSFLVDPQRYLANK